MLNQFYSIKLWITAGGYATLGDSKQLSINMYKV